MAVWPNGVITKTVTAGPAFLLEDGAPAAVEVVVRASRSLTFDGQPLVSITRSFRVDAGQEVAVRLPVCDMRGVKDSSCREIILAPGEVTHTYTVTLRFYAPGNASPIETRNRGPFALFTDDPEVIDLDRLIYDGADEQAPGVWVGDRFSAQLEQGLAAAEQAVANMVGSQAAADGAAQSAFNAEASALESAQQAQQAVLQASEAHARAGASAASSASSAGFAAAAAADAAFARAVADRDWTGPVGPVGPAGPAGPATIRVGTVRLGNSPEDLAVVNVGTANEMVLDFTIPRGQVAIDNIRTWNDFDTMFG